MAALAMETTADHTDSQALSISWRKPVSICSGLHAGRRRPIRPPQSPGGVRMPSLEGIRHDWGTAPLQPASHPTLRIKGRTQAC